MWKRIASLAGSAGLAIGGTFSALALASLGAGAQTPEPKASQPRTGDIVVPLQERHGSGVAGTVTLHPQGNKTMIDVTMFSGPPHLRPKLTLRGGGDCTDARLASTQPIPLNPINTGHVSRTFVQMPIAAFSKSSFVVDVRDATTRQQALEGCAQLGP